MALSSRLQLPPMRRTPAAPWRHQRLEVEVGQPVALCAAVGVATAAVAARAITSGRIPIFFLRGMFMGACGVEQEPGHEWMDRFY
jgi:hypothetical protein